MQKNYDKILRQFFQAAISNYQVDQDPFSSAEESTMGVMNKSSKKQKSAVYQKLENVNDDNETEAASVEPIQPKRCCSRRSCILLIVWSFLFIFGVLLLTVFVLRLVHKSTISSLKHRIYQKYEDHDNVLKKVNIQPCDDVMVTKVWHANFGKLQTETAIRLIDVNSDGIDDPIVAFGTGVDGYNVNKIVCTIYFNGTHPCYGGALAIDGKTGRELWRHYSGHEIYAVNCNGDIDKDGTPDCLLGGRGGIFDAISGKDGHLLWAFWDKAARSDVMNLYTAQFIRDLNNDGVMDVLQIHGGDPLAEAYSEKRLVGRILIFSGKTGRVLRWVNTPDGKESYFSPLLYTLKNGTEIVVFGTGGETHGGSLFVIPLMDLFYGKIHKAVAIYTDKYKGVMNPPVLIDLTNDGTVDMLIAFFNSTVAAIDGESFNTIWSYSVPNSESYSVPAAGFFNGDNVYDFMARFNVGNGFPVYYYSNITVLDGKTGEPIVKTPYRTSGAANPSPLTISMEGTGNDLFLYWIADCLGHEGEGGKFEFVKGTNVHEQSRADTCYLRFKTRGFSRFNVMNSKMHFPGKTIYDSELYHKEESLAVTQDSSSFKAGNRFKRHIGVPDHGGIQRLIATGGLTKALSANTDRFGYSDSIDIVFPVYWMFPAKTRLLTAEDIKCVENYRKLIREGKVKAMPQNNKKSGFYDEGDAAVNYCLKDKAKDKGRIYQSQSTYDPKNIHLGSMTVYRFNIKCICNNVASDNEQCSRMLPMSQQGWGGYMGSVANGFYNKRENL